VKTDPISLMSVCSPELNWILVFTHSLVSTILYDEHSKRSFCMFVLFYYLSPNLKKSEPTSEPNAESSPRPSNSSPNSNRVFTSLNIFSNAPMNIDEKPTCIDQCIYTKKFLIGLRPVWFSLFLFIELTVSQCRTLRRKLWSISWKNSKSTSKTTLFPIRNVLWSVANGIQLYAFSECGPRLLTVS
jgi:hypothetical protein